MKTENYPVDFVKRTRDLIDKHYATIKTPNDKEGLEVTFLLNCLLGLIVAVVENENSPEIFKGNLDRNFLDKIPEKVWYLTWAKKKKHKIDLTQYRIHKFLKKLRNGIAHQNIIPINENGQWTGVIIQNKYNGRVDFEIEFTVEELKSFADYIAAEFERKKI